MRAIERLREVVDTLYPELVTIRRHLHQHPELSWKEIETTAFIEETLRRQGVLPFRRPLKTGGYVDFVYSAEAPFLLFRADIDALPIQDLKTVPYRSKNEGVCHACGHDVHTTVVLGLALALKQLNFPPRYNVRLVFQPAEEPIPGGASKMVTTGILEGVRYVFGLHVEPRLPVGSISLTAGWVNMQSIRLDLRFQGRGGHSARPQDSADLISVAARFIQESQLQVARQRSTHRVPAVLTFTEISAGEGYNSIPSQLRLTGTLRVADSHQKRQILQDIRELLSYFRKRVGCRIKLQFTEGSPAVVNHPELIQQLKANLEEDFWLPAQIAQDFRSTGGDDFGFYTERLPGAMIRFGSRQGDRVSELHTGNFDIGEEVIRYGVSFFLHQIYKMGRS